MSRRLVQCDAGSRRVDQFAASAPGAPAEIVGNPSSEVLLPEITQTPADDALRALVLSRLSRMGRRLARRIAVSVVQGAVILEGTVDTLQEKRLVLDAVRQIGPVQTVRDRISVVVSGEPAPVRRLSPRAGQRLWQCCGLTLLGGLVWICLDWEPRPHLIQTVQVKGLVEVRGRPAEGAFVALHPVDKQLPDSPLPRGQVGPGGAVEWSTFRRGDGLPAGEYVVVAAWHRMISVGEEIWPGPNLLSPIYRSPETSPLRIRVTPDSGTEPMHLRLE